MKIVKSGLIPFLVTFLIIAVFSGCDDEGWNSKKILPPPGTKARVKVQVNVVKIRRGDIYSPIMATGTILPQEESRVGAKISGRIEKIFVYEGDEFEKGDILVKLEQQDFLIVEKRAKAELAVARASLREAELHLGNLSREKERLARLYERKVISQQKYDDINTSCRMAAARVDLTAARLLEADANLSMAKQQLRDSVIRAPFSGIVAKKFSNEAEIVSSVMPSRPILWLMKIDRVKVEVEIPDVKMMVVRKGTPVDVKIDALPGKLFEGNVSRVNAMVDPISRNFKVETDIPNSEHMVKPGMFARITVKTDVVKDTIIVPQKALVVDDAGNDAVFVLNDNEAVIKRVTVGVSNANMVEIRDGLKVGEKVIVTGNYGLEEGTGVSPTVVTY